MTTETNRIEYKLALTDDLEQEAVAFLNSGGGSDMDGINATHRTGYSQSSVSSPVKPVRRAVFTHSQLRRCFNHDYRAPAFYMVTITTHERRPWFSTCANNASTLTDDGWLVYNLWHRIPQDYPQIAVNTLCIMPDHLHGILRVKERMEKPVGVAIRAFKSQCTSALRKKHNNPVLTLWNPGYNDRCVWRRGSLQAFVRYLMDNPRRYCLKKAHPDLFRKIANIQHPCLPPSSRSVSGVHAECQWAGYGNRFLLDRPEKRAVRVSRKATPAEIAALREEVLAEAAQGVVIVSPFISPGEREIATAILAAPTGDVILMKPDAFPPLFKPNGRYFDLCVQGRLLILSSASLPSPPLPGIESGVHVIPSASALSRETCLAMNAACTHIAEIAPAETQPTGYRP
jgi:REP element-mobilizing transposase RayT